MNVQIGYRAAQRALESRLALRVLLLVAGIVHIASAALVFFVHPESISTTPDPLDYRLLALNILEHQTFTILDPNVGAPSLLRTPLYPLLLAGTYLFDNATGLLIVLFQSVLVVVMGYLVFRLLCALRVQRWIAFTLTAVYMFEPLQWLYTLHTMTETLTSFFVLILLSCIFLLKHRRYITRAVLFGLVAGLLLLTKPTAFVWIPFLLFALYIVSRHVPFRTRLLGIGIACVIAVLVVSPWLMRNYQLVGEPILSSSAPFNFALGLGDKSALIEEPAGYIQAMGKTFGIGIGFTAPGYPAVREAMRGTLEEHSILELTLDQIACMPQVWFDHKYPLIARLGVGETYANPILFSVVDNALWIVLLALFLAAPLVFAHDTSRRLALLALYAIVGTVLFINVCISWTRMLLPVYPIIFIGVGITLTALVEQLRDINK